MISDFDIIENIVGKVENAGYFLLFPQYFQNAAPLRGFKTWDCAVNY